MGCKRNPLLVKPELALTTQPQLVGTIPTKVVEGQMTFTKHTAGDEVYIGIAGRRASAADYDYKLTDVIPSFTEEGIVPGDVYATGSAATAKVSTYISGS